MTCNVLMPQLLWFSRVRTTLPLVFVIAILVNVGMWFERFVIIVTSLHRDFLPSSWADYAPTIIEIATLIGSFGLFFTCFLLFCRIAPVIAMAEVKGAAQLDETRAANQLGRGEPHERPRSCWPPSNTKTTCWPPPTRFGGKACGSSMPSRPTPCTGWTEPWDCGRRG